MAVSAQPHPDPEDVLQRERDLHAGLTVGVVEDSDEDYAVFQRVLSRHAAQARVKRWGRAEPLLESLEAGALAPDEQPDVMIVDLTLPGIDGVELVRRLRSHPVTEALPVFVLSGSGRQRDIDRCYEAGADAYFRKSGSSDDLRTLLDTVLNAAPRRAGQRADVDPGPLLCTARRAVAPRRRWPSLRPQSLVRALRPEWQPGAGLPHGVALISQAGLDGCCSLCWAGGSLLSVPMRPRSRAREAGARGEAQAGSDHRAHTRHLCPLPKSDLEPPSRSPVTVPWLRCARPPGIATTA